MNPLSFVHWVVCPSLYGLWWHHGQKRKGSSEAIKRRRTENPMNTRERAHQRP
jgi:hypothetical protein